ncbi:LAMI_0G09164g1_1 [Lachancea mirantina]|uniref:LAMI_0G09164g1_1 n=1 Tax=Lachancea mirantina TaxID=1230905 RepID=A0A1G4KAD4_9SACH|nr:LAMI_0G09164g1_1 [Lachancea mirantina]
MERIYRSIHARCRPADVVAAIENAARENAEFKTQEFVENIQLASARNAYYAKALAKACIDHAGLFESSSSLRIEPLKTDGLETWPDEWLYEKYIELLPVTAPAPTEPDLIRYTFGQVHVDIQETPNLISAAGSTGFRTWAAAPYLCAFIAGALGGSRQAFEQRVLAPLGHVISVLELGCGTGLVGLTWTLTQADRTRELCVTDGDPDVVTTHARANYVRNGVSTENVRFQQLRWNLDPVPASDLIIAADVSYDATVVPDLVRCLSAALRWTTRAALVAAAVRNYDTISVFEAHCRDQKLHCEIIETTETSGAAEFEDNILFKKLIAPIRIYLLTALERASP